MNMQTPAMELQEVQENNKKRKGFTLVELVVVVAIVAILALIAIPAFANMTGSAKLATFESNHEALRSAVTMYAANHLGELPNTIEDLKPYISDVKSGQTVAQYFTNRPKNATYKWENEILTSELTGLDASLFDGTENRAGTFANGTYTITYSPKAAVTP